MAHFSNLNGYAKTSVHHACPICGKPLYHDTDFPNNTPRRRLVCLNKKCPECSPTVKE